MINLDKYKEEFNSSIDEDGEYTIGENFARFPSDILGTMDQTAYQEQLEDFVNQKKADYNNIVYQSFPAPIAYYFYQTEYGYENEHQRLHFLRDTWESVTYILFALILGEVNKKNFSLAGVRVFNNQAIRIDHNGLMSDRLGYKLEFIYKVLEYDKNHDSLLNLSSKIELDTIEAMQELNNDRNSFSHTTALSPNEATNLFEELYPKVLDLLFELDFLENVSILKYVNNDGSAMRIKYSKFDGHSLQKYNHTKEYEPSELTNIMPILNNSNILIEFAEEIFNVTPFIYFHNEGAHLKLCFYKQIDRQNNEYKFELIGGAEREMVKNISLFTTGIQNSLGSLI